jgi:uncharacterized protein (TIGR02246 family)
MAKALLLMLLAFPALAQDKEILAVILKSAGDWNRGDIEAFVKCYEDSPETTFVGTEVSRGTAAVLERYRRTYASRDQMGKTTFSELRPRVLSPDFAIVTGRFTLDRPEQHGGRKTGLFTLVMRKTAAGWRIVHDHTHAD